MDRAAVEVERVDRVATLTLNRPAKKNALDLLTWHAIHAAQQRERDVFIELLGAPVPAS